MKLYSPKRVSGKTSIKAPRFSGKTVKMPKMGGTKMKVATPKGYKGSKGRSKVKI